MSKLTFFAGIGLLLGVSGVVWAITLGSARPAYYYLLAASNVVLLLSACRFLWRLLQVQHEAAERYEEMSARRRRKMHEMEVGRDAQALRIDTSLRKRPRGL